MFRINWLHLSLLAVLVGVVGCNSEAALTPATGVVTLDEKPIDGATVTFSPAGENEELAIGKTDASGNFELNTPGRGPGAAAGSYTITIVKSAEVAGSPAVDPRGTGEPMSKEQMDEAIKQMKNMQNQMVKQYESVIPAKYGDPKTSEFTADVAEGGDNNYTFEMTTK